MKKFTFVFFVLTFHRLLLALYEDGDPSVVAGVNVISGEFSHTVTDHVVNCPVPFSITRTFTGRQFPNYDDESENSHVRIFEPRWSILSELYLIVYNKGAYWKTARMRDSFGRLITFKNQQEPHDKNLLRPRGDFPTYGNLSGNQNPHNYWIKVNCKKGEAVARVADGGKRYYRYFSYDPFNKLGYSLFSENNKAYLLVREELPSGHIIRYTYFDRRIVISIRGASDKRPLGTVEIDLQKKQIDIKTSDSQIINYIGNKLTREVYLTEVTNTTRPTESYKFKGENRLDLGEIRQNDRPAILLDHYREDRDTYEYAKVKQVSNALGDIVARFEYFYGLTRVFDVNDRRTDFYHDQSKITQIDHFDLDGEKISSEKLHWHGSKLSSRIVYDAQGKRLFAKEYGYDFRRNVIHQITHSEEFCQSKHYKYSPQNLLVEEREDNGPTIQYEYLPKSNLITRKQVILDGEIISEETFRYDKDHLLIEETTPFSFTRYDRFPDTGLVHSKTTPTGKIIYSYNKRNQVTQEEVYDSENNYCYTLHYHYDKKGRVTTSITPLGSENTYLYDDFGNVIEKKEKGTELEKITYDPLHRILEINGTKMTYDKKGNLLYRIDERGIESSFNYDAFDRCTQQTYPTLKTFEYDLFGNITKTTEADGAVTSTTYTSFQKPRQITHPSGAQERFYYNSKGLLESSVQADGLKTTYTYDGLNRLIRQSRGPYEEIWNYEGLLLKSHQNETGLLTEYTYDNYGRMIEQSSLDRSVKYEYNALGVLERKIAGDLIFEEVKDFEDQIIKTSENGFNVIEYIYDSEGRNTQIIRETPQDISREQISYDEKGRPAFAIDPLNQITIREYEDFSKKTVDPLHNITLEYFNDRDQITKKERKNSDWETTHLEEFSYDNRGRLIQQTATIYQDSHPLRTFDVAYEYDIMGRKTKEIENGSKVTSYDYDLKGRLIAQTDPNQITIYYTYNELDQMASLQSSDGSIDYEYIYDPFLVEIKDNVANASLSMTYNPFGDITSERYTHKISKEYDANGRMTHLILPDSSAIHYTYENSCLTKVARLSPSGKELYSHTYDRFDMNKHVEEESLIHNLGKVTTKRDLMQRPTHSSSQYHAYELSYGHTGLVTDTKNSLGVDKSYKYDSLNQLIQEGEEKYEFDSLGNPLHLQINDFNQIIQIGDEKLSYDNNGNLIKRGETLYTYDALNRLISMQSPDKTLTFAYDPLSRLVSHLYDGELEIGKLDADNKITELKVLGLGVSGDLGATIAIELDSKIYAPLHDLRGHLVALLSADGEDRGELVEIYDQSAFGEESSVTYINPWRFSSKRHIEDLVFFGKRFYSPALKRFISPDPLGYSQGLNLYAYVLNSPLNHFDLLGLHPELPVFFEKDLPLDARGNPIPPRINYFDRPAGNVNINPDLPIQEIHGMGKVEGRYAYLGVFFDVPLKIKFTEKERQRGFANIFDHLDEILPATTNEACLGIFTHGICNGRREFLQMGRTFADTYHLPQIGLFNETRGISQDVFDAVSEINGLVNDDVKIHASFLSEMCDLRRNFCPLSFVLENLHSRTGGSRVLAYQRLRPADQEDIATYNYCLAIAPSVPSPEDQGHVRNIFSSKDHITDWFVGPYLNNPDYDIRILECKTPFWQRILFYADHAYNSKTYMGGIRQFREDMQKKPGIARRGNR